jgi:hypothetical protein
MSLVKLGNELNGVNQIVTDNVEINGDLLMRGHGSQHSENGEE